MMAKDQVEEEGVVSTLHDHSSNDRKSHNYPDQFDWDLLAKLNEEGEEGYILDNHLEPELYSAPNQEEEGASYDDHAVDERDEDGGGTHSKVGEDNEGSVANVDLDLDLLGDGFDER
jgi:hypothetical protein